MLRWDREVSVLPRIAHDTADLVRHAQVDQDEKQSIGLGLYTLPVLKSVRPSPKAKDRPGSSISPLEQAEGESTQTASALPYQTRRYILTSSSLVQRCNGVCICDGQGADGGPLPVSLSHMESFSRGSQSQLDSEETGSRGKGRRKTQ